MVILLAQLLTKHSMLFYYMCGTPSLFGGGSALAFFTAVGAWVWLDSVNQDRNRVAKICAVALGGILVLNTCVCFYLGGSMKHRRSARARDTLLTQEVQQVSSSSLGSNSGTWLPVSNGLVMSNEPVPETNSNLGTV